MKKNISNPFVLLFAGMLFASFLQAQESVNASGGDAVGSGGTVAYSIGQVAYTTNTSSSGNIAQGVQQAYEIYSVGITETELNISLNVFPNPTSDNLTLQISDYTNHQLSYQLVDLQGKLLSNGLILTQQTKIDLNNFPCATYFVNVINQENKIAQSFKIIKK
jgi:hypothetical protein